MSTLIQTKVKLPSEEPSPRTVDSVKQKFVKAEKRLPEWEIVYAVRRRRSPFGERTLKNRNVSKNACPKQKITLTKYHRVQRAPRRQEVDIGVQPMKGSEIIETIVRTGKRLPKSWTVSTIPHEHCRIQTGHRWADAVIEILLTLTVEDPKRKYIRRAVQKEGHQH